MKKIQLAVIAFLFTLPFVSKAQTWSGSTPGNIYYNSGNVGIGTTSSTGKLEVNDGNGTGVIAYFGANGTTNAKGIYLSRPSVNTNPVNIQGTRSGIGAENISLQAEGGFVGIGTSSPGQILDVQGTTTASTFHVQNLKSSGYTSTLIYGQMTQGNSPDYDLVGLYNNTSTLKYQVRGDGAVYMSGNVGIGTTIPTAAKLVLNSGTTNQNALVNGDKLAFTRTSDAAVVSYLSKTTDLGTSGTTNLHGYDGIIFRTSGPEYARMTITQDGKVGIGTSTPDELLSVNGTIHSKEIKVDVTGLPDYVFKPTYHLPTLSEIKTYIDQNQHLPEVPSAKEAEQNGLNLGDMNKLLLKKVEELTLYLIEKDNEITRQNSANQAQQKEIMNMKAQLKDILDRLPQK